jgi:hypothetical protein
MRRATKQPSVGSSLRRQQTMMAQNVDYNNYNMFEE